MYHDVLNATIIEHMHSDTDLCSCFLFCDTLSHVLSSSCGRVNGGNDQKRRIACRALDIFVFIALRIDFGGLRSPNSLHLGAAQSKPLHLVAAHPNHAVGGGWVLSSRRRVVPVVILLVIVMSVSVILVIVVRGKAKAGCVEEGE